MRKVVKTNKKAFTLVEVMLAIAIMMITMPCIIMLIITIVDANKAVYRHNDVIDYAYVNKQAFENRILNAQTVGSGDHVITCTNGVLTCDGAEMFDVGLYFAEPNGVQTWDVRAVFSVEPNGEVTYNFIYYLHSTGEEIYTDIGIVYIPHINPMNVTSVTGSSFSFSDY